MTTCPNGKGAVCKTALCGFDSHRRLQCIASNDVSCFDEGLRQWRNRYTRWPTFVRYMVYVRSEAGVLQEGDTRKACFLAERTCGFDSQNVKAMNVLT